MTFRWKCMKHLAVLGVVTVILQIIVSTKYHPVKMIKWQNISELTHRDPKRNTAPDAPVMNASITAITATNNSIIKHVHLEGNPPQQHVEHHEGHNGFELASSALSVCKSKSVQAPGIMNRVHVVMDKRLLYCPMEKIGTTFWRRLFYMLTTKDKSKFATPYDVPIKLALDETRLFTQLMQTAKSRNMLSDSSFSFLFVRNPYSRLLSAFIDKVVPPNPYYWKNFGGKAVAMFRPGRQQTIRSPKGIVPTVAHDATFAEFVKFATNMEKSNRGIDPHIISTNKGCKPCLYPYKYIGRMETFKDDAFFIMSKIGLNSSIKAMDDFNLISTYDAIEDSIYSPFSWKKEVLKNISWEKALKRVWLKLQMRGIISMDIPLDISPEKVDTITNIELIDLAKKAHHASDPDKLRAQKSLVKREAFASVPLKDIIAFRDAFKEDFVLFGYDREPSYIYDRKEDVVPPSLFFNYSHLN